MLTFESRRKVPSTPRISGTVAAAAAALDVDLAVQQRRGGGVPARAVHVVAARQRVVAVVEDVAVVVAGVGGAAVDVVVAAGEEDVAALRQDELRAAEDVGAGDVRQREVAAAGGPGDRIPDVVDEEAGLHAVAVGAVGQHAAIRREHRVRGDQRPGERRRPGATHVVGE